MTLDEAIKHAEEVMVENMEKTKCRNASDPIAINCFECAEEHRQLAEWLKELKKYKEKDTPKLVIYSGDGYADGKMVYDYAECPNCGREFEKYRDEWEMPFCCACGQALKWEEEE